MFFNVNQGLYGAGNDEGRDPGNSRELSSRGFVPGFALNSGRIAGEDASARAKGVKGGRMS